MLEQLFEKMGRGVKLTPPEQLKLRDEVRALEEIRTAMKGWLRPGSADPNFNELHARTGIFETLPNNAATFTMGADPADTQAVPNDAINTTPLEFTDSVNSNLFSLNNNGTIIDCASRLIASRTIWVMGSLLWPGASSGYRRIYLAFYDLNGSALSAKLLCGFPGDSNLTGVSFCVPLCPIIDMGGVESIPNEPYQIKIEVQQTSGIELTVRNGIVSFAATR